MSKEKKTLEDILYEEQLEESFILGTILLGLGIFGFFKAGKTLKKRIKKLFDNKVETKEMKELKKLSIDFVGRNYSFELTAAQKSFLNYLKEKYGDDLGNQIDEYAKKLRPKIRATLNAYEKAIQPYITQAQLNHYNANNQINIAGKNISINRYFSNEKEWRNAYEKAKRKMEHLENYNDRNFENFWSDIMYLKKSRPKEYRERIAMALDKDIEEVPLSIAKKEVQMWFHNPIVTYENFKTLKLKMKRQLEKIEEMKADAKKNIYAIDSEFMVKMYKREKHKIPEKFKKLTKDKLKEIHDKDEINNLEKWKMITWRDENPAKFKDEFLDFLAKQKDIYEKDIEKIKKDIKQIEEKGFLDEKDKLALKLKAKDFWPEKPLFDKETRDDFLEKQSQLDKMNKHFLNRIRQVLESADFEYGQKIGLFSEIRYTIKVPKENAETNLAKNLVNLFNKAKQQSDKTI